MSESIKAVIFDWGDTLMRDFPDLLGPMYSWEKVDVIDGVKDLLENLFGKFILAVATNAGASDTSAMIRALERVGIAKYFQHYFSSIDLGYMKPDQRFFDSICNNIDISPVNCVMIGNIYEKDITGAKDAGMITIFFNEKKVVGDFEKADHIVNNMSEIKSILI